MLPAEKKSNMYRAIEGSILNTFFRSFKSPSMNPFYNQIANRCDRDGGGTNYIISTAHSSWHKSSLQVPGAMTCCARCSFSYGRSALTLVFPPSLRALALILLILNNRHIRYHNNNSTMIHKVIFVRMNILPIRLCSEECMVIFKRIEPYFGNTVIERFRETWRFNRVGYDIFSNISFSFGNRSKQRGVFVLVIVGKRIEAHAGQTSE